MVGSPRISWGGAEDPTASFLVLQGTAKDVIAEHKYCRTQWQAGQLNTHPCPGTQQLDTC